MARSAASAIRLLLEQEGRCEGRCGVGSLQARGADACPPRVEGTSRLVCELRKGWAHSRKLPETRGGEPRRGGRT